MLTTLALSAMLFAPAASAVAGNPASKEAAEEAAVGTLPPRIVELKADADGKVKIAVVRPKAMPNAILNLPGGVPGIAPAGQPVMIQAPEKVELTDVKDLKVTTAGGKEVKTEDALKSLAKGGTVIVTADGKNIAPAFLKMFKEDVLVLVSPELTGRAGIAGFGQGAIGVWTVPAGPGNPRPVQPAPKKD